MRKAATSREGQQQTSGSNTVRPPSHGPQDASTPARLQCCGRAQEDRAFPISCHNSNTAKTPSMQCAAPCNKMTKHTTCSSRKCAANTHLLQAVARAARKHADVVHQPAALGRHKVADAHVGLGVAVLLSLLAQPEELGAHGAAGLVLVHLAGEGCTGEGCEQGQ